MRRKHRLNAEIRVPEVRVVGEHGDEILGVMTVAEAMALANERGVDLVEISPKAVPPVCKLIDYGKMLYSLKKKEHQMKKATKARELKGIRLTFKIDVGDAERQKNVAEKFLLEGHPVRIVMKLKGREKAHTHLAVEKLSKFIESLSESGAVDQPPRAAGFQIIATLKPNAKSTSH
jgi:translation initiation factor IF-3